ncbi:hypothetical protein KI387_034288, partial [Taxus chinensis]
QTHKDGYYIAPAFMDKLVVHIAKNFMNLLSIKDCIAKIPQQMINVKVTMEKRRALQGKKPQIVGVVIESQEAEAQASKTCELLFWISKVGVKHVSLYDME